MLRLAQRALLAIPALAVFSAYVLLGGGHPAHAGVPSPPTRFDDPVPGVCLPGDCSLREAIISANVNPGPDTITLGPGTYTLSLQGQGEDASATGDLDVTGDLTVEGSGPATTIIDGGDAQDTIFDIPAGATVAMTGLTIRNASPGSAYPGGLDNSGTLSMSDCAISDNTGSGNGGGAWNDGTMTLNMCTVSGNSADGHGGGLYNRDGTLTITNSTISGNTAAALKGGGGIGNNQGTVIIDHSTITGNSAGANGGGIDNDESLAITDSAISNNDAGENGGGIYSDDTLVLERSAITGNTAGIQGGGVSDPGDAVLRNVTVSANSVPGNGTGGVYNPGGDITVINSTIVANTATHTGGLRSLTDATLKNTIVANNIGTDCSGNMGAITSAGHNLDGDNTCDLTAAGDLPNTDPMLGPLADNGGPTQTHALLAGSPAIDAGDNNGCPPTDQRGIARPQGGVCDIGAFEASGLSLQGDVNCDGVANAVDALLILRLVAQLPINADCMNIAGDVNCDGAKTAVDALGVLRYVASLPVNQNEPCADIGTPL